MRRTWPAVALCLALGAVPATGQPIGSLDILGGLSLSGPALAVDVRYLAELGRLRPGLEAGLSGLNGGGDVWYLGGVLKLGPTTGTMRPYGTLGVADYQWKVGRSEWGWRYGLLGFSLGGGVSFVRPGSRWSLETELRWHRQLQRLGAATELSFMTATAGIGVHW